MTHIRVTQSLAATFTVLAAASAFAQTQSATKPVEYYRAQFLKTKPGMMNDYLAFLHKNMPAINSAGIKAGAERGWALTRVVSPNVGDHDLIGIYSFDKWEQLEPKDSAPDYIKQVMASLGFTSPAEYAAKRDPMRDSVRSEWWHRVAGTTQSEATAPKAGEYVVMSFLKVKPGQATAYHNIWKSYSLPVQEERVKRGQMKSYSMWSVLGAGEAAAYDHVSLVRYATFKAIAEPGGESGGDPLQEKVHHGKDWRQMSRDMTAMRSRVSGEIVKIVERVAE